jgi:putative secretion ATPase (PEP-CTERM system associated)
MYEAFYKLSGKPFRLTPDTEMVFPSHGHKRAMSYLLYGLEQGEGFVMITGAVGTGKTLLIQKLFEELDHRNIAMASIASANLDGEDILPAVASAFDLPFESRSKEALRHDVKEHLMSLCERHSHALLVVDEAQMLTPAALEMLRILSNFERKGHALLQVFLVGQSELRQVIIGNRLEQLRQRITASHRLEPLERNETREYILYRLRAVGWDEDPELAAGIFPAIHRASRGIARKINLIMDRLLLYGYLEELHRLDIAALTTVLDEIRDEMPDAPPTLEPIASTREREQEQERAAATAKRKNELAVLELKRKQILLDLMQSEMRLKQMLNGDTASTPATDDTWDPDAQRLQAGLDDA